MASRLLILLGLAACDHAFGIQEVPTGGLAGFSHRKHIALAPAATLADFPVSIALSADPDLAARATSGDAIAFTDADGQTPLEHEIVAYDPATGALDAWVRVPALAPGGEIYLYYGASAPKSDPTAVWGRQYAGVWHMSEAGTIEHDRTSHHHDVVAVSTVPQPVPGISGLARGFDGVADALVGNGGGDATLDLGTRSFAFGAWVQAASPVGDFDIPLHHGGSSSNNPGFDLELGRPPWAANLSDGVVQDHLVLGGAQVGWTSIVVVADRATATATGYVDGVAVQVLPIAGLGSVTGPDHIQLGSPDQPFHGAIEEVRIYADAIDADWIAAEYANLAARSAFMTIGPDEAL